MLGCKKTRTEIILWDCVSMCIFVNPQGIYWAGIPKILKNIPQNFIDTYYLSINERDNTSLIYKYIHFKYIEDSYIVNTVHFYLIYKVLSIGKYSNRYDLIFKYTEDSCIVNTV